MRSPHDPGSFAFALIISIALTVFYYDQRIRREGVDIEMRMDAAGMSAGRPSVAAPGPGEGSV